MGWGTLPAPLQPPDSKLYGLPLDTFTGSRSKVKDLITQWERYWSLNYNNALMRVPYTRAMLFLTYIKGDLTTSWSSSMGVDINNEVRRTHNPNADDLWNHVYNSFRRNFADLQEQERAEDTLQKGIHMEGDKFDEFTALYKRLTTEAGYDCNSRLGLKFFTDGLPHELYRDTLRLDRPCNYNDWKAMVGE